MDTSRYINFFLDGNHYNANSKYCPQAKYLHVFIITMLYACYKWQFISLMCFCAMAALCENLCVNHDRESGTALVKERVKYMSILHCSSKAQQLATLCENCYFCVFYSFFRATEKQSGLEAVEMVGHFEKILLNERPLKGI